MKINLPNRWGTGSNSVRCFNYGQWFIVMVQTLVDDNKKLWFGKNGTFYNSGNPATGTNATIIKNNISTSHILFASLLK